MISNPLETKINEILRIPGADRTDEQNAFIYLADIMELYEGIKSPKDISEEIEEHFHSIKNKELTAEHREIFNLPLEARREDSENVCNPGIYHWLKKGEYIDRFCKILDIEKGQLFHEQIKQARIYDEDVRNSEWFQYVIDYKWQIKECFGFEFNEKTFRKSPLAFFKTFCLKVMGISCTLRQKKTPKDAELKPLFKQHMNKEDIYRKHYGGTPTTPSGKRKCSEDWIDKKIKNGDELTHIEKKHRTMRRHVEVHRLQPPYRRYLTDIEKTPLLKYKLERQIENNKQNRRTSNER